MSDPKYNFQYVQKLVLFSEDWQRVLLAQRKGEQDYDGIFTFIGGKMETADASIVAGMQREKNEEIGAHVKLKLYVSSSYNLLFRKKDGNSMIIPHYAAQYIGGGIELNEDEYAACEWVHVSEVESFEPKIENIPEVVQWALMIKDMARQEIVEI